MNNQNPNIKNNNNNMSNNGMGIPQKNNPVTKPLNNGVQSGNVTNLNFTNSQNSNMQNNNFSNGMNKVTSNNMTSNPANVNMMKKNNNVQVESASNSNLVNNNSANSNSNTKNNAKGSTINIPSNFGDNKPSNPVKITGNEHVNLVDNKTSLKGFKPSEEKSNDTSVIDKDVPQESSNEKSSKFRNFSLLFTFTLLLLIIMFLPEISHFMHTYKQNNAHVAEITEGSLVCKHELEDGGLDFTYVWEFGFRDNKLLRIKHETQALGDAKLLNNLNSKCMNLSNITSGLSGVEVECKLSSRDFRQKQMFNYSSIDVDEAYSAYVEAGGVYPNFYDGESIITIEKEMNASGYKCTKR